MQDEQQHTQSKDEVREADQRPGESVRQEAEELREDIVQGAQQEIDYVRQQAREFSSSQRDAAVEKIEAMVQAMQASVESLEARGEYTLASYWRRVLSESRSLADWMRGKPVGEMWHQTENYVRHQPWVAFGGAMAAGFLLTRVLRSSAPYSTSSDAPPGGHIKTGP